MLCVCAVSVCCVFVLCVCAVRLCCAFVLCVCAVRLCCAFVLCVCADCASVVCVGVVVDDRYPILDEGGNMIGIDSLPKQATIPAAVDKRKQKKISGYYY